METRASASAKMANKIRAMETLPPGRIRRNMLKTSYSLDSFSEPSVILTDSGTAGVLAGIRVDAVDEYMSCGDFIRSAMTCRESESDDILRKKHERNPS